MRIKAFSLWQPWASLIAVGAKKYETRSWATSYRGPLLICAAKRPMDKETVAFFVGYVHAEVPEIGDDLPFGRAVAIVDLTDCIPTVDIMALWLDGRGPAEIGMEINFGDFSPGRYAWKLENVRAIDPFPVKGRQGLFEVEIDKERLAAV